MAKILYTLYYKANPLTNPKGKVTKEEYTSINDLLDMLILLGRYQDTIEALYIRRNGVDVKLGDDIKVNR